MKRRALVYGVVFVAAAGALAANEVHVYGLERQLEGIADEKIGDFTKDESEDSFAALRVGASVVATKSYLVFGDVSGKVSVFLQHDADTDEPHMEGFEFFFVREPDGVWRQTDSGVCSSEECTQEGLRVLKKLDEGYARLEAD